MTWIWYCETENCNAKAAPRETSIGQVPTPCGACGGVNFRKVSDEQVTQWNKEKKV